MEKEKLQAILRDIKLCQEDNVHQTAEEWCRLILEAILEEKPAPNTNP